MGGRSDSNVDARVLVARVMARGTGGFASERERDRRNGTSASIDGTKRQETSLRRDTIFNPVHLKRSLFSVRRLPSSIQVRRF